MGWSKEELLIRANKWAEKYGYEPVTEDSFKKWKKEGLVPKPKRKGLGRGLGTARREWSWLAYRRIIRIIRMREQGIPYRRDQRLILWFEGNDIPLKLVRKDLIRVWELSTNDASREMRSSFWGPSSKVVIPIKAKKYLSKIFSVPSVNDNFLNFWGLKKLPFILLKKLELAVMSKDFEKLFYSYLYSFFDPEYEGLKDIFAKEIKELPDSLPEKKIMEEELGLGIESLNGAMADIEQFDNPVIKAFEVSSDLAFINVRDFILIWNVYCKTLLNLVIEVIKYNPKDLLGRFPFIKIFIIKNIAKVYFESNMFKSTGNKLVIFAFLLRRSIVKENDGEPFRKLTELRIDRVLNWMAVNFKDFTNPNIGLEEKISLFESSPFPNDIKKKIIFAERKEMDSSK